MILLTSVSTLLGPYRTLQLVPPSSSSAVSKSPLHSSYLCRFLKSDEAQWCIEESEVFARERGGWMTDRHGQFPTLDFAVKSCPVIDDFLEPRLAETVLPSIGALYGIQVQDLTLDDLFVVKYEAHRQISGSSVEATPTRARSAHGMPPRSQQASLDAHYDETLLSFSVLLSNPEKDFKGGGTRFSSVQWSSALLEDPDIESLPRDLVKPAHQGDLFVHCGHLTHEGNAVTEGTRYLLVGFVNVAPRRHSHRAYRDYLTGMGRLTNLRRLAKSLGREPAGSTGIPGRSHCPRSIARRAELRAQLQARRELEYDYTSRALVESTGFFGTDEEERHDAQGVNLGRDVTERTESISCRAILGNVEEDEAFENTELAPEEFTVI